MRTKYTETIGVEDCTVQSIWGYLENDLTYLDDEDEYREKLVDCLGWGGFIFHHFPFCEINMKNLPPLVLDYFTRKR